MAAHMGNVAISTVAMPSSRSQTRARPVGRSGSQPVLARAVVMQVSAYAAAVPIGPAPEVPPRVALLAHACSTERAAISRTRAMQSNRYLRHLSKVAMWRTDPWAPVRELARWHVTTQIGARRNALLACTALAQRRREQDEVAEFLSRLDRSEEAIQGRPDRKTRMPR